MQTLDCCPDEEIAMKRSFKFALTLVLPLLIFCLCAPAAALADNTPPESATLAATQPVPDAILSGPAVDALERLVFRYENVHFNLNSSVLLPAGKRALDRKIDWLAAHPETTVIVEGHCDPRGSSEYNMALGTRRAEAARAYLTEQGVAPERIQVVSWGEERPDYPGTGEHVWALNRRAEVVPQ